MLRVRRGLCPVGLGRRTLVAKSKAPGHPEPAASIHVVASEPPTPQHPLHLLGLVPLNDAPHELHDILLGGAIDQRVQKPATETSSPPFPDDTKERLAQFGVELSVKDDCSEGTAPRCPNLRPRFVDRNDAEVPGRVHPGPQRGGLRMALAEIRCERAQQLYVVAGRIAKRELRHATKLPASAASGS